MYYMIMDEMTAKNLEFFWIFFLSHVQNSKSEIYEKVHIA